MTKKLSFLTACVATAVFFSACKKNGEPGENPEPDGGYTTVEALYPTQTSPSLKINIDNDGENTVTGASGTQYVIPDSAFTLMDGTPVFGTVSLELKEYVTKKNMIFHRVLPLTDTSVLTSYGAVYIQATKNSAPLKLKAGEKIAAFLEQNVAMDMATEIKLFTGVPSGDAAFSTLTWKPAPESVGGADPLLNYVVLYSSELGYLQAANYQTGDKRKVTLNLSGFPDFNADAMLRTYVLYDDLKTTYALDQAPYGYRAGAQVMDSFVANRTAHFVAFGVKDGFFYGGIKKATISADTTLPLELVRMEAVDLFSQMAALK